MSPRLLFLFCYRLGICGLGEEDGVGGVWRGYIGGGWRLFVEMDRYAIAFCFLHCFFRDGEGWG